MSEQKPLANSQRRRGRGLAVFAWTLIVLGWLIVLGALSLKLLAAWEQNTLLREYEQAIAAAEAPAPPAPGTAEPALLPERLENPDSGLKLLPMEKPEVTAILSIPKIELKVAVSEGTDANTLKYAAGHFIGAAAPGAIGNYALIAHRNYTYGQFFNRLDELEPGDTVSVQSGADTYTYIVTDTFVVNPEDTWVLNATNDATITLITCTPVRVATHRLIVKGVLQTI